MYVVHVVHVVYVVYVALCMLLCVALFVCTQMHCNTTIAQQHVCSAPHMSTISSPYLPQKCAQVLLTQDNLSTRSQYNNAANTFFELLKYGAVPVVNENDTVAVEQLRFGDNDTLSALVGGCLCLCLCVWSVYDIDTLSAQVLTHTSHIPHTYLTHTSHTPHIPHTRLTYLTHTSHTPHRLLHWYMLTGCSL